jgi:hypothetical protein
MTQFKALPHIDNLRWLIELSRPFPVSAEEVLDIAITWKFSESTIKFLKQFPADEIFDDEEDFTNRYKELRFMKHEEWAMPIEIVRES